jgi:hypothetical protein
LLDEDVRFGGVAAAKNGSCVVAEEADSILVLVPAPKIGTVAVVDECKDAAADRYPRLARVTGRLPRFTEYPDLLRGRPLSSFLSVELCRFIPSLAAQPAVAFEPAPHQIRSRRPSEYG